jgi:hypothetical protein
LLEHAGTVDDASKASAQYVKQSADAGEKENGRNRKLNKVRNLINLI